MRYLLAIMFFAALLCNNVAQAQTTTWQYLDSMAMHMASVVYKTTPDTTLKLYYLKPANTTFNNKLPAVIWIHGGAWVGGKANTFFANAAYCSLKNTIGFSIDYRLISNNQSSIYNCIADCKSAIRYIKTHAAALNVDTNKIVLVGESAGGHLAACMALLDGHNGESNKSISTIPYALVLYNPVVNVATGGFIKFMDAAATLQKAGMIDTTALLQQYQTAAKAISPLYLIKKALPATLVINGIVDKVTPYEYAVSFSDSLKKYYTKCQLVLLPNMGHAFSIAHYKSSEQQVIDALLMADSFLTKLGIFKGDITLVNGNDTNWLLKKK